jgi:hypothetical protein
MSTEPLRRRTLAKRIVDGVLDNLHDRRGYRQTWDEIDDEIRAEIVQELTDIVHLELVKSAEA